MRAVGSDAHNNGGREPCLQLSQVCIRAVVVAGIGLSPGGQCCDIDAVVHEHRAARQRSRRQQRGMRVVPVAVRSRRHDFRNPGLILQPIHLRWFSHLPLLMRPTNAKVPQCGHAVQGWSIPAQTELASRGGEGSRLWILLSIAIGSAFMTLCLLKGALKTSAHKKAGRLIVRRPARVAACGRGPAAAARASRIQAEGDRFTLFCRPVRHW
jgi:hypothetical protein